MLFFFPDDNTEHCVSAETPPPISTANTENLVEAKEEMETQMIPPPEIAAHSIEAPTEVQSPLIQDEHSPSSLPPPATFAAATPTDTVNKDDANDSDTVDAPVGPSASLSQKPPVKMEEPHFAPAEKVLEHEEKKSEAVKEEEHVATTKLEAAVEVAGTVNMAKEEIATKMTAEVSQPSLSEPEPAAPQNQSAALNSEPETEFTPAETTDIPLSNGLSQDPEELSEDMSFSDTTPLDKADVSDSQESTPVVKTAMPTPEEEEKEKSEDAPPSTVSCPKEESTAMQGIVELFYIYICDHHLFYHLFNVFKAATSVPKKRKNMKEFNKKEAIGDLLDAFTEVCICS